MYPRKFSYRKVELCEMSVSCSAERLAGITLFSAHSDVASCHIVSVSLILSPHVASSG